MYVRVSRARVQACKRACCGAVRASSSESERARMMCDDDARREGGEGASRGDCEGDTATVERDGRGRLGEPERRSLHIPNTR